MASNEGFRTGKLNKQVLADVIVIFLDVYLLFYFWGSERIINIPRYLALLAVTNTAILIMTLFTHFDEKQQENQVRFRIIRNLMKQALFAVFFVWGSPITEWDELFVPVLATSYYAHVLTYWIVLPPSSEAYFRILVFLDHFNLLRGLDMVVQHNRMRIKTSAPSIFSILLSFLPFLGMHASFVYTMVDITIFYDVFTGSERKTRIYNLILKYFGNILELAVCFA